MKKCGWRWLPTAFFLSVNFLSATNSFAFLKDFFYFILLFSIYIVFSKITWERILPVLTAGIATLLFITGLIQKFILFPRYLAGLPADGGSRLIQMMAERIRTGRIYSIFPLSTLYAVICGLLILFILHFLLTKNNSHWHRLGWGGLLVLGMLNLYFTASFGGILSLFVCLIFYLFLTGKIKMKILFPILMASALLFFLVLGIRFSEAKNLEPVKYRLGNWNQALRIIGDSPWIGVGLGNYRTKIPPYVTTKEVPSIYAHNLILQTTADLGIPLSLLLFFLIAHWIQAHFSEFLSEKKLVFSSGLLLIFLYNLIDIGLFFPVCGILIAFLLSQAVPFSRPLPPWPLVLLLTIPVSFWLLQSHAESLQTQADILAGMNQKSESAEMNEKALRWAPFFQGSAELNLAFNQWRNGDITASESTVQSVLRYTPYSAAAHFLLSRIMYEQGKYGLTYHHARLASLNSKNNTQYREWYESVEKNLHIQMAPPGN